MAQLEAVLRISAEDNTAKALAGIREKLAGIEKTAGQMDKYVSAIGRVTKSTDPFAASVDKAARALATQRSEIAGVVAALDNITGPTDRAAAAQRNLTRQVEIATGALARQGEVARRGGGAGRSGAGGGHGGGALGMLPFAGPAIEHGAAKYFETGATVEQEIAMLKAMGAKPEDIARAQADWRALSKTYAGASQSDFLAGYRQARTTAPDEAFEMATLGAKYRLALRNSGLSASDADVESIVKIMDERGFKTQGQREDFINQMVKTQQAFGDQIKPETMLAAIRNAGQSVYDWSPKFANSYLPTILQSMGERGGTQIMTAFNNWVGGHLSHAELKAMSAAGFVGSGDLLYNNNGDVKGIKPGAHMYKSDLFKSDIADWAWDFHKDFMSRKGATESGFDDLIARMPRNMAALVSFLVHNEGRFMRDADTRELAIGGAAAGNEFLAANPVAGLDALKTSLEAFAGVVSEPAMKLVGQNLEATAAALQRLASVYGEFAKDHPDAAAKIGIGVGAGAAAAGGYLSWKMLSGMGRFFGFGGGGAGAAGAGDALIASGPPGWLAAAISTAIVAYLTGEGRGAPMNGGVAPAGAGGRAKQVFGTLSSAVGAWGPPGPLQVSGEAKVTSSVQVEVKPSSSLLEIVRRAEDAAKNMMTTISLNPVQGGHSGRMDSDAAPIGGRGVWDR